MANNFEELYDELKSDYRFKEFISKMELEQILEDWLNETKAPLPTEINPEYIGK